MKASCLLSAVVIILLVSQSTRAQSKAEQAVEEENQRTLTDPLFAFFDSRAAVDVMLLSPSGFLYFDESGEPESKVDLYDDGEGSFNVELFAFDLLGMVGPLSENGLARPLRLGASFGTGISSAPAASDEARVLLLKYGFLVQLNGWIRFEGGRIRGYTADESFAGDDRRDIAWYVGVTLPTQFAGVIKKAAFQ
jgi:hypothetical protein